MASQKRRLEISRARFDGGLIGYMEVLDSEREFLASQQASIQVRRSQLESAAQLYKALGGGLVGQGDLARDAMVTKVAMYGAQK
jgi:multidrug efflux system outer membrane protein